MELRGKAFKFGDNVNTDYIISGKYKFKTLDMNELAKHIMEDLDPDFSSKLSPGDFIVCGTNFGCGSSREQAPLAIKHAGVGAVIAKSFARIFYRNCVNTGLPAIECDTTKIEQGDVLEIDFGKGVINNITKDMKVKTKPMPKVMQTILLEGGLIAHFKKHGGFSLNG